MSNNKRCWRITPTPALEYAVESLARKEGRSLANMMFKLLGEAIDARRKADADVSKLVAAIRGTTGVAP